MFVAPLFGTALVIAVATNPLHDAGDVRLSLQEKAAATEPLVRSATMHCTRRHRKSALSRPG